jgi:hypothetical protein
VKVYKRDLGKLELALGRLAASINSLTAALSSTIERSTSAKAVDAISEIAAPLAQTPVVTAGPALSKKAQYERLAAEVGLSSPSTVEDYHRLSGQPGGRELINQFKRLLLEVEEEAWETLKDTVPRSDETKPWVVVANGAVHGPFEHRMDAAVYGSEIQQEVFASCAVHYNGPGDRAVMEAPPEPIEPLLVSSGERSLDDILGRANVPLNMYEFYFAKGPRLGMSTNDRAVELVPVIVEKGAFFLSK